MRTVIWIAGVMAICIAAGSVFAQSVYEADSFRGTNASYESYFLGDVGIGTNSPLYGLDVDGTMRVTDNSIFSGQTFWDKGDGASPTITFINGLDQQGQFFYGSGHDLTFQNNRDAMGGDIFFNTRGGNTRIAVLADGDVGIGTTAPTEKLHVDGNARLDGSLAVSTNSATYTLDVNGTMRVTDNSIFSGQTFWDKGSGASPTITFINGLDQQGQFFYGSGHDLTFQNNRDAVGGDIFFNTRGGNTRMTVLADGDVGIGTTAPSNTLHVAGSGRFDNGITYIAPLGDLSMGTFTNMP